MMQKMQAATPTVPVQKTGLPEVDSSVLREAEQEAQRLIEMMSMAEKVNEQGSLASNPVINTLMEAMDGEQVPVPMKGKTSGAGYVRVYRTSDGSPRRQLAYLLPMIMRKKREDGQPAFTLVDPGYRPVGGQVPCRLSPDDEERERWDRMGLPYCHSKLPSLADRQVHLRSRHPRAFKTIEADRLETERAEQVNTSRMLAEALARLAETSSPRVQEVRTIVLPCQERGCDHVAEGDTVEIVKKRLAGHMNAHRASGEG